MQKYEELQTVNSICVVKKKKKTASVTTPITHSLKFSLFGAYLGTSKRECMWQYLHHDLPFPTLGSNLRRSLVTNNERQIERLVYRCPYQKQW